MKIEFKNGSIIESIEPTGKVTRGRIHEGYFGLLDQIKTEDGCPIVGKLGCICCNHCEDKDDCHASCDLECMDIKE